MPSSDDKFSDCDLEEDSDNDEDYTTPSSNPPASSVTQPSLNPPTMPPPLPTEWSSNLTPLTINDFNSPIGATVPVPETASEVFDLMFTTSFLDTIVEQSNLYAKQVMGEKKYTSWDKLTREELRAYLGFCILMCVSHLPALDDYWSTDPTLHHCGQDIQRSIP